MTVEVIERGHSSGKILVWALVFSLLMHVLFFVSFPTTFYAEDHLEKPTRERIIRVQRIKPDEGQLVDIQDQLHETTEAVDTNYLSDRNRKVEKQTRSINITKQQNQSTNNTNDQQAVEKKSKYSLNLSDRAIQNLTEKNGQIAFNQSLTSNYLPEITIGNETLLNTKEFAFNAFYIRMKRDVEGFWHPSRIFNQNSSLHGTYITTLTVILDQEGYLVQKPIILKSSGIPGLDQEASQSIEQASPFLNPPEELFKGEDQLRMNWSFIFNASNLF